MMRAFVRLPLLVQGGVLLAVLVTTLGWSAVAVSAWLDQVHAQACARAVAASAAAVPPPATSAVAGWADSVDAGLLMPLLCTSGALGALVGWAARQVTSAISVARYAQRLIAVAPGAAVVQPVRLDVDEATSRNELHRLNSAVRAVGRALRLAQAP